MRISYLIFLLFFVFGQASAEGCRELAPNGNVTALYVGKTDQGNFATFGDLSETNSRLNIRILDPLTEFIHMGFSRGVATNEDINGEIFYRFVIKDPNNNTVYESDTIYSSDLVGSLARAQAGPSILSPNGYDGITLDRSILTSKGWTGEGDYYIEFDNVISTVGFYIRFWDITVTSQNGSSVEEEKGRLWSKNWVLFMSKQDTTGFFLDPFEGSFYVVAQDDPDNDEAFIHYLNFDGSEMQGAAFGIAFNNFGAQNSLSPAENRRSVFGNATRIGHYPIYLNNPQEHFKPPILGHARFIGTQGCLPNYCILVEPTSVGEIEILIDLSGDNLMYDPGTEDVLLVHQVDAATINTEVCVCWDGINGFGVLHDGQDYDELHIEIIFGQGVFHLPFYDVEINKRGFTIESIQPIGPPPLIYYDDSNIPFSSGTMSPNVNLDGCIAPCHTWIGSFLGANYGNHNTINSWWYTDRSENTGVIELLFEKRSSETHSICRGDSFRFQDSTMYDDGDHNFFFFSRAGCDSVHTIQLDVIDFQANINTDVTNLNCDHPSITLDGFSSIPRQRIDYFWKGPDGFSLEGNEVIQIDVVNSGLYSLTIIEQTKGCTDRDEILLTEDFLFPQIDVTAIPLFKCKSQDKNIEIAVDNSVYDPVIEWRTADGIFNDLSNPLSPVIITTGTYEVIVRFAENGCGSTKKVEVERDTISYLEIEIQNNLQLEFCSEFQLMPIINSPNVMSYQWTPDTLLSCGDCSSPVLTAIGEYEYLLTARDTNNCTETKALQVHLNEDYEIYIPSAFSPNNDGINDQFRIYSSECAVRVEDFTILNRWGDRVFRRTDFLSTDVEMSWDGFVNGEVAEKDVYTYYAALKIHNGETVIVDGDVQLVK